MQNSYVLDIPRNRLGRHNHLRNLHLTDLLYQYRALVLMVGWVPKNISTHHAACSVSFNYFCIRSIIPLVVSNRILVKANRLHQEDKVRLIREHPDRPYLLYHLFVLFFQSDPKIILVDFFFIYFSY